jgi:hypothetical protein
MNDAVFDLFLCCCAIVVVCGGDTITWSPSDRVHAQHFETCLAMCPSPPSDILALKLLISICYRDFIDFATIQWMAKEPVAHRYLI